MTEIHKKKLIDLINSYQTWPEKRNAIFDYIEKEIEQPLWNAARENEVHYGKIETHWWKYRWLEDYNNRSEPLNEKK